VSYSVIYNLTLYEYYTVEGTTHCGIPSESNMLREPSNPNVVQRNSNTLGFRRGTLVHLCNPSTV